MHAHLSNYHAYHRVNSLNHNVITLLWAVKWSFVFPITVKYQIFVYSSTNPHSDMSGFIEYNILHSLYFRCFKYQLMSGRCSCVCVSASFPKWSILRDADWGPQTRCCSTRYLYRCGKGRLSWLCSFWPTIQLWILMGLNFFYRTRFDCLVSVTIICPIS